MNILLRILLFLFAVGALFFVLKKVRNSQAQIESAVFWILFMLGLVIISIFPGIAIFISELIGIESPVNFVYLCIIFLLLLRVFNLSLQLSKFQYQIQQLTQIIALEKSHKNEEKPNEEECDGQH
jgi:hypothetical protein